MKNIRKQYNLVRNSHRNYSFTHNDIEYRLEDGAHGYYILCIDDIHINDDLHTGGQEDLMLPKRIDEALEQAVKALDAKNIIERLREVYGYVRQFKHSMYNHSYYFGDVRDNCPNARSRAIGTLIRKAIQKHQRTVEITELREEIKEEKLTVADINENDHQQNGSCAHVEIEHVDHSYTATVFKPEQLVSYFTKNKGRILFEKVKITKLANCKALNKALLMIIDTEAMRHLNECQIIIDKMGDNVDITVK